MDEIKTVKAAAVPRTHSFAPNSPIDEVRQLAAHQCRCFQSIGLALAVHSAQQGF